MRLPPAHKHVLQALRREGPLPVRGPRDSEEITRALNAQDYRQHFLYGLSMSGIIVWEAVGVTADYDAALEG